jgi:hypothetical protein
MANSAVPLGPMAGRFGPPAGLSGPPLLRVVSPQALTEQMRSEDNTRAQANNPADNEAVMDEVAKHIRTEWDIMRNHRNGNSGWSERLLHAQRTFNGQYTGEQLAAIQQFGGSDVYARVVALKCRGASALLREVYITSGERPWGLDPTPEPTLPDDLLSSVAQLVTLESANMTALGQAPDINAVKDRTNMLITAAKRAAKKKAKEEAKKAEASLDDVLVEGGFYDALTEFITDLPLFPFACIKGPVVRIVSDIVWANGAGAAQQRAKMFWNRISPFDVYWTPGASSIRDAAVIERSRVTRADLNDLIGLPGYSEDNLRKVLDEYGRGGLRDWADTTDSERAHGENRENPTMNRSNMIDMLEYHGNIQGRALREYGMSEEEIPDEDRDYFVQAWLIGRYVIKVQVSPNPRKRHPYYITSFEKVPGTPVGNALPDILADIQEVCNASLRSLVNNMSLASGPQVVVDEERLAQGENGDDMYPWKRWRVKSDPLAPQSTAVPPISFFQPNSNAQELLVVYEKFTQIADELSAIPRYMSGSERMGGAGRTASGLAMLMGNASKILQMVAQNIDQDVMRPALQALYDMKMLTDQTNTFRGDEAIRVRGVEVATQRETTRARQIELLQGTANPIDMQILGLPGRAKLLKAVSEEVGIEDLVPDIEEIMAAAQGQGPTAPGEPGVPTDETGQPTQGTPPTPQNNDLGVQQGNQSRQVTQGSGAGPMFKEGGRVPTIPPKAPKSELTELKESIAGLAALVAAPTEITRDPVTGAARAQKVFPKV